MTHDARSLMLAAVIGAFRVSQRHDCRHRRNWHTSSFRRC